MFNRLLGKPEKERSKVQPSDLFDPRMPDVDDLPDIEVVFDRARKAAAGEMTPPNGAPGERHLILVTPGRMLLFRPCPPAGSMSATEVAAIEKMLSSSVKRNIAVIACTELKAITADIAKVIPFLGFLMGFAYIGHAVWIFEGHPSALTAGCQEADLLIVDGGMVAYLQEDWIKVASGAMRKPEIYVHDRQTYSFITPGWLSRKGASIKMSKKEAALSCFDEGFSCSQSVFAAYAEELGVDRATALKIAGGFGGGMGRKAETCGAVSGALMALGLKYGPTNANDKETKEKTYALVREFIDAFEARHGSILCKELLGWDISTAAGHETAKYKQLFSTLCPNYVAGAAEIVDEIMAKEMGPAGIQAS